MGLIERAHSFKDKVARGISPSMGLFTYPVLMAADILLYDAEIVPVGKDQVQHLEMTRDMAQSFNALYGEVFVLPKFVLGTPEPVPGVDGAKMSKSYGNHIPIFAQGKALKKLVMSIKTDSTPLADPKDPKTCTVFELFSLFTDEAAQAELAAKYRGGNFGYGHAKLALLEVMKTYFAEAQVRKEALERDPARVEAILQAGAARARLKAREVLTRARRATGLAS